MKRIEWLKLYTGFFEDEKIILLLSMRAGEKLVIFFLRLLTISAKQNQNGKISFSDNVPYSVKDLANICQIPVKKCEDFLKTLEQFGIIYTEFSLKSGKKLEKSSKNKYIFISNWEKHQSTDRLEKIRQQQVERSKRYREKQQECNVTVTLPSRNYHAIEVEVDKEVEVELDKEKEQKEYFFSQIIIDSLYAKLKDSNNQEGKEEQNNLEQKDEAKPDVAADVETVDKTTCPIPNDTCTFLPKVKAILKHLNDSTGSHFRCTEFANHVW
jgi:predicted phage replisome organizer